MCSVYRYKYSKLILCLKKYNSIIMFKKKKLLGLVGSIICIGGVGMTIMPNEKKKGKDLVSKLRKLQKKYNSFATDIKTIENTPKITMVSLEDAIEHGYTSDTFNLLENNKGIRKIDISETKPLMDEGHTFEKGRLEIVNRKIDEVTLISY